MTAGEIVERLKPLGSESYRRIMRNHGAHEPLFGVKIAELKKIQKQVKKDYQLALELYNTGIYDAMYLAGLIADERKMTRRDLQRWLKHAKSAPIAEYTVAWVAAESQHGRSLALEWIESDDERTAATGWATLSGLVAITDDAELDLDELRRLLEQVRTAIHQQPNQVRYAMNASVIAIGSYVRELTGLARQVARDIGSVTVDMGATSCQTPNAADYIAKVDARGAIGKKRKSVRC
jgi:3-methyladenine DNA glycosylase AlkD